MERRVIETGDGSYTLELEGIEETYHSRHGAVQESRYVFILKGLTEMLQAKDTINVLEVGFGTGLNALLTREAINGVDVKVNYHALETTPLELEELSLLGYVKGVPDFEAFYQQMHEALWDESVVLDEQFAITKLKCSLEEFESSVHFDLIYFDAFGPRTQPHLWSLDLFKKLAQMTNSEGVFVTYCAKGQVRRDLIEAGFEMERLSGPPGKRHMLRGVKP
ncbi:MAG: tRNA U34 5-methylaminomethyl-2-thiouridine-forming methyltransferase MnmC [Flavobacteriales bacterium]|jgi:tRNA U34 5-methylaminomethyl-2-thiouridine-forming methyltransferase MnmC